MDPGGQRFMLVLVLDRACTILTAVMALALGCARSAPDRDPADPPSSRAVPPEPAPDEDAADEIDDASEDEVQAEPDKGDASAEHISFDGPDAEPMPSDQVVAPPQRPPMPSMMTDVLQTGPRPR